jgi:molecular chaperone GrpE
VTHDDPPLPPEEQPGTDRDLHHKHAPGGSVQDEAGPAGGEDAVATEATAALDAARAAAVDLENRLRRALADLANLRRRCDRELAVARENERARVAAAWLPIVDDLERALQHADGQHSTIVDGLKIVLDQAQAVLSRLGYPRFDDVGKPYDPLRHEAVGTIAADAKPGTVVATVRPGYGAETLLRPAGVIVAQGPANG